MRRNSLAVVVPVLVSMFLGLSIVKTIRECDGEENETEWDANECAKIFELLTPRVSLDSSSKSKNAGDRRGGLATVRTISPTTYELDEIEMQ
jgi:hypothetical protein